MNRLFFLIIVVFSFGCEDDREWVLIVPAEFYHKGGEVVFEEYSNPELVPYFVLVLAQYNVDFQLVDGKVYVKSSESKDRKFFGNLTLKALSAMENSK